jgi:hypothetical protein
MTDRKQISYMQERNARLAIQKILIEEWGFRSNGVPIPK